MNNKKIQAQMQIDVSFIGNTTKLVKDLQTATKGLNLSSTLTKQFETDMNRSFKETLGNLSKLTEGLGKKGFSAKQYTDFFNNINLKIQESTKFIGSMKTSLQTIFKSQENKQAIKELEAYKKQLEEINKLVSAQKGSQTRRSTAIQKMKDETGIDYNISKRTLSSIANRRANNQDLTKTQQEWMAASGLDETKLKRVLELLKQINAQNTKINDQNAQAKKLTGQTTVGGGADYLEKQIGRLNNTAISEDTLKQWMTLLSQLDGLIKKVTGSAETLEQNFNAEMPKATSEAEKLAKASATINEILGQFGIAFTASTVVRGFQELARSAFEFYKSLDSALNEIYVVSNLTIDSVNGLKSSFISMAKDTGVAIDDITRSATLFYQQGLNTKEVMEMTEVTSQFAKVAGIDATDAADKLTAAVNGYCLAAEDAALVADKFNKVAAASAADINELSTAFSKAAAQANQAGVGMDNYLAYIATMVEATREAPENIGTSLKTIMSRMQQVKEAGTTEDGETDVNQVETALKSVGVALRDANGELRDLEEVFADLGPKWQTLDRNTQAYLGTIIAGTRQQSRFITLMQNWDRVLDLSEQSANSAGQQALMHAKAMDSIESKLQQFQVAWQEFVSNLASSDLFKGLISGLTKLLDLFNGGNQPIILLSTAIGLLSTKLKDLQSPIVQRVKDLKNFFTNIKNGLGTKTFATKEGQQAALTKNQDAQQKVAEAIQQKTIQLEALNTEKDQTKVAEKRKQLEADIAKLKKDQTNLAQQEKEIGEAKVGKWANFKNVAGKVGQVAMMAGTGLQMAGAAVGTKDANAGGVLGAAGSVATAIGQFATGNWIGGIISAGTSIFQITQTIENWDENIKARVEESVNAVGDALGNANNLGTGIKSTEDLLDNYDELSRKMHKTQAEQEQLNSTVQQLGDTYGVDVLTDAYGNLSINIAEVRAQLELQKAEQEEAIAELTKIEQESMAKATSGLGNDTTMAEYLDQMFSANAADYKTLLNGIDDGLTAESRNVSEHVAKAFSTNLKTAITNEVRNNADEYIYDGFANGIKGIEDALNEGVDSETWNELYSRIDFLEQNINDMTYEEAQEYLKQFYDEWGQHNAAIKENWDVIVDSINNTVFKNQSLLDFFGEVEELQNKGSETYWENDEGTGKLDKIEEQLKKAFNEYNSAVAGVNEAGKGNFVGLNTADGTSFDEYVENLRDGRDSTYGYGVNDLFRMKEGDQAADKLDNIAKAYKEALEEQEKFYQNYSDEHGLDGVDDAKAYIEALGTLKTAFEGLTQETLTYMGSLEQLHNTEGMKGNEAAQYAETVKQALEGINLMGDNASDADRYNYLAQYYEANKDQMKDSVKAQWEEVLEEAFNELEISTPRTLKEIGNELKSISSDLINMNDIISEFNDNGGMTLDTFMELADIIDGIDLDAIGQMDPSAVQDYIDAIHNLNLAYDENNGYITMNGDSLQTLQDIQELQTKSKLAGMIADLKASRATTETQIAYIDAQIAATQAAIEAATMNTSTSVTAAQIKGAADEEYAQVFDEAMTGIVGGYENDVTNQGQWSTAILSNISTVADAWSKYFTGVRNQSIGDLEEVKNKANTILNGEDYKWEGANSFSGIDWDKYGTITKGSKEQTELLGQLNSYKQKLENTKASYQATLDLTDKQISMLEGMYNSDLSKLGQAGKGDEKELDQYIGKLKEIYNILNRIQNLEHRLSTLDTYSNVAEGEQYGKYLQQRIGLNEELLGQYEFLVTEQKKFTNGYKDFIESSAVADVFDFDEFGQIIIDFEKYNKLQDTAKDGEKSLKEQADELYETYTGMYDELQGYFDEYIAYLEQTIDLNQEMVDAYVDIEKQAASAIKEIYQDMLDTKLEAIDKEIEALEELKDARDKARTDQQNAKDISNLQTNIQRTMMDSSGASDISFIKAQQDMNDKLEDIADDKYSEMLDNIIERLEQEQDALQENFDEMFDNLDWLHEAIEEDMMTNEERLLELFQQTDEWKQMTTAERKQQVDEWSTQMAKYMETIQGGKTVLDICNYIDELQKKTIELDNALKTQISQTGSEVANAVRSGIQSAYSSGVSAGGGGSNGGGKTYGGSPGGGSPSGNYPDANGDVPDVKEYKNTITSITSGSYTKWLNKTVEIKGSDKVTKYNGDGTVAGSIDNPWGYNPNVKVTAIGKSKEGGYFAKVKGDKFSSGSYWIPISALQTTDFFGKELSAYKNGGMVYGTGPAWLDGTTNKPEAVLNALQTEHFIKFTNALDNMFSNGNVANTSSTVSIDTISFNVESMSSPEDGEAAFNMFVNKFKEIGSQSGIKIDSFKNRL
jgi:TP901 family phage tail tape measure protein